MKAAILDEGGPFTLFGGEPLLVPLRDLEDLWAWGLDQFGKNSVQTNGTLITDAHIELFKRYSVEVGISLDGPGELNDLRWNGTLERTRHATEQSQRAIERLCGEGRPPSIIVTLHRANATREKLPALCHWIRQLDTLGVQQARLHSLESETAAIRSQYSLSTEESIEAYLTLADLQIQLQTLTFDVFGDLLLMLTGRDSRVTCVWGACDTYTTRAVQGVEGSGQRSNCGRTNKDGIDFVKSPQEGFERYIALYQTPQAAGGCRDCRFFLACKGHCPGTAIDGDWRNRTEHCGVWMSLFERMEQQMIAAGESPLSASDRRAELEGRLVFAWSQGTNPTIASLLTRLDEEPRQSGIVGGQPCSRPQLHSALPPLPTGVLPPDRLDFQLPPFARIGWVSQRAFDRWDRRVSRIGRSWSRVEWMSVREGLRSCALLPSSAAVDHEAAWGDAGLTSRPLGTCLDGAPGYLSSTTRTETLVIGSQASIADFCESAASRNWDEIARLLDVPLCCQDPATLLERHACDPIGRLLQLVNADGHPEGAEVTAPSCLTNPFWRVLNIRALSHLPCQLGCEKSIAAATDLVALGKQIGLSDEMSWLQEILMWPVEWTALHGIAELKSPIARVVSNTEATATKYRIRLAGTRYPLDGADGAAFPYRIRRRIPVLPAS